MRWIAIAVLCAFLHEADAPVVLTGASRPATSAGADGPANLDQCGNGPTGTEPCLNSGVYSNWVNGNLGASKSKYLEGDSIPYWNLLSAIYSLTEEEGQSLRATDACVSA